MAMLDNTTILISLLMNLDRDKREWRTLVRALSRKAPPTTVNGILAVAREAKNPKQAILDTLAQHEDFARVLREMHETGHHAMAIMPDDEIIPIKLLIEDDEDHQRLKDNEPATCQFLGLCLLDHLKLAHIECKIVLLRTSGFSGTPRTIVRTRLPGMAEAKVRAEQQLAG